MHKASQKESEALRAYLSESVSRGDDGLDTVSPRDDVTIVMYFFWSPELAAEKWPYFEGALRATWRTCGKLKTVLVSNAAHPCSLAFAEKFSHVEVQVEPSLIPGDINTMSVDCNVRLYSRFSTKYVLIVQDDGFPLRPGLDEFVNLDYDFIGSPYCRPRSIPNALTWLLNYCPSNGGFSLRSRRICELASQLWKREFASRKFVVEEMSEDLFYTRTLPKSGLSWWLRRRQAPSIVAERFSYEGVFDLYSKKLPFGFHTATGFAYLARRFNLGC